MQIRCSPRLGGIATADLSTVPLSGTGGQTGILTEMLLDFLILLDQAKRTDKNVRQVADIKSKIYVVYWRIAESVRVNGLRILGNQPVTKLHLLHQLLLIAVQLQEKNLLVS